MATSTKGYVRSKSGKMYAPGTTQARAIVAARAGRSSTASTTRS